MVQLSINKRDSLDRGLISFDPPLPSKDSLIQELRKVIATGSILFEGKPLIVDTFTDLKLEMEVLLDKEAAFGSILCKTAKRSFPLHTCTFVSMDEGPIILFNGTLYFSSSMIEWSTLKKGWEQELFELSFKEVDRIRELLGESVQITGESSEKPIPLLKLTDGSGGFANLYFHYGKVLLSYTDPAKSLPNGSKRDFIEEKEFEKLLLETHFIKKNMGVSNYFCPLDKVKKSLLNLKSGGFLITDHQDRSVFLYTDKDLEWTLGDKNIILKGSLNFEGKKLPLSQALQSRERFYPLSPSEVALLPDKEEIGLSNGESFEIFATHVSYPRTSIALFCDEPKDERTPIQAFDLIYPASDFIGTLRPYQRVGLSWMHHLWQQRFSALLADDMGLGKTIQVLALLSLLPPPHCIVVPKSLLSNWAREIDRFLPARKDQIMLTTYNAVRENTPDTLFETLILDEAQAIKNSSTKTAAGVRKIKSRFRLSLTGTPIENHLSDLISQFEFLLPGMALDSDPKRLFKKVRPFLLRRTKQEVLKDLPARDDQVVLVDMAEEQESFYQEFLRKAKGQLLLKVRSDGVTKHRMEIFELILRLRQIACHPLLMTDVVSASGKIERVVEDLEACVEEGSKVIVFSQFTSLLALLKRSIKHPFLYLDGETKERQLIVDRFQEDPSSQILLSSLKVGGVGLNLTEADYVFLLDPWWNDAVEEQAISRAHRLGRTRPVISRRYLSKGTIEEKMMELKSKKRALSENLFTDETILDSDLEALLS